MLPENYLVSYYQFPDNTALIYSSTWPFYSFAFSFHATSGMTCHSPARSVCHRCVHQLKCFISSHLRLSSGESLCLQSVSQSFTCFLFSHFNKFLQKRRWRSDEGLIVDYLQFVCLFTCCLHVFSLQGLQLFGHQIKQLYMLRSTRKAPS